MRCSDRSQTDQGEVLNDCHHVTFDLIAFCFTDHIIINNSFINFDSFSN